MGNNKSNKFKLLFESFSSKATKFTGSSIAFLTACFIIFVWGITGPMFNYSDTWQLVINTGTTIVTFLMVFLIQQTQNKDSLAIHLKLNELIAVSKGASNRLIDSEEFSEEELLKLSKLYHELSQMTKRTHDIKKSHSIEETRKLKKEAQSFNKTIEDFEKNIEDNIEEYDKNRKKTKNTDK